MTKVKATVHGAVSIVNAIANQKGATLGISLCVEAIIETIPGKGISIQSENKSLSSRLINKTVEKIVSKKDLEQNIEKSKYKLCKLNYGKYISGTVFTCNGTSTTWG